ncbi:MAG TPA: hypothetical protein VFZ75_06855 [Actinomycetota bacterium]|nr:hypothetical protein [Actinomycetota bacterium]
MSGAAPPAVPGASGAAGARVFGVAAAGGSLSFVALLLVGQLAAWVLHVVAGTLGFAGWANVGVLVALASVRGEIEVLPVGPPSVLDPGPGLRSVPFLLTIGFLWLVVRAGRRAARGAAELRPLVTVAIAAAGAAAPVGVAAAVAASLVSISIPGLDVTVTGDPASAGLWAGALTAAGAATGALFELRPDAIPARLVRGAIVGVVSALALLVVVVLVVATVEPAVTRAYADGLGRLGGGGAALFGAHVVGLPAQSALLFAPAAGTCLDVLTGDPALRLCPWALTPTARLGDALLGGRVPLSPWLWVANVVPIFAAAIAGRVGANAQRGRRALEVGAAAGVACGALAVLAAWFVTPRWFVPSPVPLPLVVVQPRLIAMAVTWTAWGLTGGVIGGWFAARRYEGSPSPTSV